MTSMVVHHLDGDRANNSLDNLVPTHTSCHTGHHKNGRRKDEADLKKRQLQIRVTEKQQVLIQARAHEAGRTVSDYVRLIALGEIRLPPVGMTPQDPEPTEDTPDPPKPDLSNLDERLTKVLGGSPTIEELGGGYKGRKAFEARVEDENVETAIVAETIKGSSLETDT